VRRLHEKLFYRPLLDAVARLEPGSARLTLEAAQARLVALGFADPAGALRHIDALTSGISRRATVQKALLPVMLSWFADSPDPDAGLLAFRQVSDALGSTPWYLRLLRDEGAAAERMARVLGSSVYASDLLLRAPDATVMFGDDDELAPAEPDVLLSEATAIVARQQDSNAAIVAIRGLRRRELLRTGIGDVLGRLSVDQVCTAVSTVADVVIEAGLQAAIREVETRTGAALPTRIAVIGMGRFGGRELGYGSDADVMFVHDPLPGVDEEVAGRVALDVANELTRLLAAPAPDPPLLIDANLRPEGKQGPLVRSLASYASYYSRWSLVWESQALLRAAPVAGDHELGEQFVTLINPMRYPEAGLSIDDEREIRRIKARVETERLPRGTDPKLHLKLGPGGLADVEWTVQLLQLKHGFAVEGLRTTSTLKALEAAADEGLMTREDANVLSVAWQRATHLRNVVMLTKGKAADALPTLATDQAKLAQLLTRGESTGGEVIEGYLRVTRRARAVVERVFYG
jgi:glutamate-ammonia-ligase adenylyltransferase